MRVRLAKEYVNSNYKVSLIDISREKDFVNILEDYNIKYKKTEYFKDLFMYKLIDINSKFIMILQEKASTILNILSLFLYIPCLCKLKMKMEKSL